MLAITKYCCYYMNVAKTTDYPLKVSAEISGLGLSNTKTLAALKNILVLLMWCTAPCVALCSILVLV